MCVGAPARTRESAGSVIPQEKIGVLTLYFIYTISIARIAMLYCQN